MMVKCILVCFFSFLLLFLTNSSVEAQSPDHETGTLIITYHTGPSGQRLSRVRLVLTNEQQEQQMYPKGNAFTEEQQVYPSRTVVMKRVTPGKYSLKFLVPNADGLFEEVPDQEVIISKNSTTKVEKALTPRYATVRAFAVAQNSHPFTTLPEIVLKDQTGTVQAHSSQGKLIAHYLVPGTYTLFFEKIPPYKGLEPVTIQLKPYDEPDPFVGRYQWEGPEGSSERPSKSGDVSPESPKGTLLLVIRVNKALKEKGHLKFKIINDQGQESFLSEKTGEGEDEDYAILIQELPAGEYQLAALDASVPMESFAITANQTTIVQQSRRSSKADVAIRYRSRFFTPEPLIIYNVNGFLTVNSNMPHARWFLYRDNIRVFMGVGPVVNLQIQPGANYRVQAEEIEGYAVRVSPPFSFNLYNGGYATVNILYQRTYGYVDVRADFADPEGFEIAIKPPGDQPPIQIPLQPREGKIFWESAPLPTGFYEVFYKLPEDYEPLPAELIRVGRGQHVILRPRPVLASHLRVTANIPEAIFLLRRADGTEILRGGGIEYRFRGLKPGPYILSFSSEDPKAFIAPEEMRFNMSSFEQKEVKALYKLSGSLAIHTNVDFSTVQIRSLTGNERVMKEEIRSRYKVLNLPEGRYRLTFDPQGKMRPPDPIELEVQPSHTEEIHVVFTQEEAQQAHAASAPLIITSNIPDARFVVQKVQDGTREIIGRFSGKYVKVPLQPYQNYEIVFDSVPTYQEPEIIAVTALPESQTIQANYIPAQQTVFILEGRAIVGDPNPDPINALPPREVNVSSFAMGTYEVTNAQYADWLNKALKNHQIAYVEEADSRGQVLDLENRLLCKTFEADPYSQISVQAQTTESPQFISIAGKESHPVINVSWYGAVAYCHDNRCRLPTEAEWEKAAGMAIERPGEPLKKFRFGFGRDTIDRTWANYRDDTRPIEYFQVLTTPVGFYNGINLLPLHFGSKGQERTHLAKSPHGAFDMSGNVWEWVSDWYDAEYTKNLSNDNPQGPLDGTKKVVKGGCYDSLADGVRVFERLGLPPDHMDAFTGFRIAVDFTSELTEKR
jgi:formylglycine-generating enzyme required for sulfatase activity